MASVTLYCKSCGAPIAVEDAASPTPVVCANCDLQMPANELLPAAQKPLFGKLTMLSGLSAGEVHELRADRISIGRDPDNRIRLDDRNVSHHHALLMWETNQFLVRDLVSTNGTYVNNVRITGTTPLKTGDSIRLGGIELRYDRAEHLPARPKGKGAGTRGRSYEELAEKVSAEAKAASEVPAEPESDRAWLVWLLITVVAGLAGYIVYAHYFKQWPFVVAEPVNPPAPVAPIAPVAPVAPVATVVPVVTEPEKKFEEDPDYLAAQTAETAKDYPSLLQSAQSLVSKYPKNSQGYFILGVAYAELGFADKAIQAFQQTTALDPTNADAWSNLGWAHTSKGAHADAVAAFQQAIKIKADDPQLWGNLGGALAAQNKPAEAGDAYQKAVALDPNYANGWYNLGICHSAQQRPMEALDAFRKAVKIKPEFVEAWYDLGLVSQKQDQHQEAVFFFQETIKRRPEYVDAWAGLVRSFLALQEFDKAGEAARELKKLDPAKASELADQLQRPPSPQP